MPPRKAKGKGAALDAQSIPSLVLECIAGPCQGAIFDKQALRRKVGRVARGNQVHLKDDSVSQSHAELIWNGTAWEITDTGSSNGSFLNGIELEEGIAHALKSGDILRLGADSVLRVKVVPLGPQTIAEYIELKHGLLKSQLLERLEAAVVQLEEEGDAAIAELRAQQLAADSAAEKCC